MLKVLRVTAVLCVLSIVGSVQADIPVTLVSQWGGACSAVAVSGSYAYASVGPKLVVLDITNPSNPAQVAMTPLPGSVYDVAVSGSYAYVADSSAGLVILHVDTTSPGSLRVDIQPAEAVAAGAQWRRVGTTTWFNSGEVEENIAPGIYTVEFKPVGGWIKLADVQVRVWPASLATAAGVYIDASLQYITIGTGTSNWQYPLATGYHDARTQIIYLASELGSTAWEIQGLALDVAQVPGQRMNNFTIRMKHTDLSSYPSSPVWESTGWTTVYTGNVTISSTGWKEFIFQTPFAYNGSQNLMIDISFNNSSYTTDGLCRYTTASANRSIYFRTNSGYGDPLSWSGQTPTPNATTKVPNVRLKVKLPATPATISSAKQMPDGTVVEISGAIVSAAWADYFYVEDENRSSGIRVEKSAHGLAAGTKVNVVGILYTTTDGERFISANNVSSVGSGVIKPLGMTNKSLGGGDIGNPGTGQGQRGVTGGVGLNNIGLLVQTTGIVTYIDEHTFTIDDGSGVNVRCETPESIVVSPSWQYVSVIGISSIRKNGENYERLLRVTAVPLIL